MREHLVVCRLADVIKFVNMCGFLDCEFPSVVVDKKVRFRCLEWLVKVVNQNGFGTYVLVQNRLVANLLIQLIKIVSGWTVEVHLTWVVLAFVYHCVEHREAATGTLVRLCVFCFVIDLDCINVLV
jgi:hypothetical protein